MDDDESAEFSELAEIALEFVESDSPSTSSSTHSPRTIIFFTKLLTCRCASVTYRIAVRENAAL